MSIFSEFLNGNNCVKKGLVSYRGYSFLFIDSSLFEFTSSRLSSAGAFYDVEKRFSHSNVKDLDHLFDLLLYDQKIDLLFAGSLKTLVPTLQFGLDHETLFYVLVIVRTPDNKIIPITYYYGPSGTSIGKIDCPEVLIKKILRNEKLKVLNPSNLSKAKIRQLLDALEGSLRKVPMTDFEGVYSHDHGTSLMGLENGKPFIIDNYIPIKDINLRVVDSKRTDSLNYDKKEELRCLRFSPDGKYIICGTTNGLIKVWSIKKEHIIRSWLGHANKISQILISSDFKYIISGSREDIKVWDFNKNQLISTLKSPETKGIVKSLLFFEKEKKLIIGLYKESINYHRHEKHWIEIWDIKSSKLIRRINPKNDTFSEFMITPSENHLVGKLFASYIGILEIFSGEVIKVLSCRDYIRCKTITSDGKYIVSSSDKLQVWDFDTGEEIGVLDKSVKKIYITKNSKYILSCGSYDIYVIDFKTLDVINSFEVGDIMTYIHDMHVSPDESYIATTDGESVKIWDWRKSKLLNKF